MKHIRVKIIPNNDENYYDLKKKLKNIIKKSDKPNNYLKNDYIKSIPVIYHLERNFNDEKLNFNIYLSSPNDSLQEKIIKKENIRINVNNKVEEEDLESLFNDFKDEDLQNIIESEEKFIYNFL